MNLEKRIWRLFLTVKERDQEAYFMKGVSFFNKWDTFYKEKAVLNQGC